VLARFRRNAQMVVSKRAVRTVSCGQLALVPIDLPVDVTCPLSSEVVEQSLMMSLGVNQAER